MPDSLGSKALVIDMAVLLSTVPIHLGPHSFFTHSFNAPHPHFPRLILLIHLDSFPPCWLPHRVIPQMLDTPHRSCSWGAYCLVSQGDTPQDRVLRTVYCERRHWGGVGKESRTSLGRFLKLPWETSAESPREVGRRQEKAFRQGSSQPAPEHIK